MNGNGKANIFARKAEKSEARFLARMPGGARSKVLDKYQGVTIGGKRYTKFSQFKVKPAGKKTMKEKLAGGIKLAIL